MRASSFILCAVCIALAGNALVSVSPSVASIPDCNMSVAVGNGCGTVCPMGDTAPLINVTLLDFFGNPVTGFPGDSICIDCPGTVGLPFSAPDTWCADFPTNGSGQTIIGPVKFANVNKMPCVVTQVVVRNGPNTCILPIAPYTIRFYDMTGPGVVGAADFAMFAPWWLSACPPNPLPADYNCSCGVGLADFGLFAGHWLHVP